MVAGIGPWGARRTSPALANAVELRMKRFAVPVAIVIAILLGLLLLTEGSAIAPFLYRSF